MMKILAATLTTGTRNKTFIECMESLINQKLPDEAQLSIVVVENNLKPDKTVQSIIKKLRKRSPLNIYHILECKRGIPHARNRALKLADELNFDYLTFIDDDAFAEQDWIAQLAQAVRKHKCQVVTGPQRAIFPDGTSSLFRNAPVYHERKINDGQRVSWGATNNILMDVNFLSQEGLMFNNELINGGEDKELLLRATHSGASIYWCQQAIVSEYIADDRLNCQWALRRAFRMGATGLMIERSNKSVTKAVLTCLFKGSAYLTRGVLTLPLYGLISNKSPLESLCDLSHGYGFYYGLLSGGTVRSYT
ncbi:glycosyltransferase family A protein [Endozoicomonas sp. SESOKO3]|uniref:glycosyltransferase family A protein n=1 Tax=Endozoicomonas sp. SESOKO3 TaxID=2828744 RepID=UPI0021489D5E|nr:glycosyltransferase family A protein [Endozoicomonas sp. SESOKO3]